MGSLNARNGARPSSYLMSPAEELPLTDDCHHYEGKHEVPWDIQKYFSQRYSIFSLYDEGIHMTDDAWFGVTPEPIANQIAYEFEIQDEERRQPQRILIDCFSGAGGNTIAFSLTNRWDRVIAIEKDAATLACAQHNARIYHDDNNGDDDDDGNSIDSHTDDGLGRITWVHGDSFRFLDLLLNDPEKLHPDLRVDPAGAVIFASPPWGGPGYRTDEIFDLDTMQPYSLRDLHQAYRRMDHFLFLPRTSDIRQIAKLAPKGRKIEVAQYCMEGASKAMGAYILRDKY